MGSRASKQDVKTPHFFFDQVVVSRDHNKEFITVAKKMMREDQYGEWERKHAQFISTSHKDSLLLAQSFEKERIKKYFACCECPADFQISIMYERFDYLFKPELERRQKQSKFYSQQQLFMIFYSLLGGLKQFQLKGIKFGDIRPSQMVVTASKEIKMISTASYPWQTTSLQKVLDSYDNTQITYLKQRNSNNRTPISVKCQAYSLGISFLEIGLLENSQDLYTIKPRYIDLGEVSKKLERLGNKYKELKIYLSLLLKQKTEERYSCGEVWAMLKNYSQYLTELKPFKRNQALEQKSVNEFRKSNKIA